MVCAHTGEISTSAHWRYTARSHKNCHPDTTLQPSQAFPDTLCTSHFTSPSCTALLSDPHSIHTRSKCPVSSGAQGAFQVKEFTKTSKMSLKTVNHTLARTEATFFSKIYSPSIQRKETLELTFLEKILERSLKEACSEWHVPGEGWGQKFYCSTPSTPAAELPPSLLTSSAGDSFVSFCTNPVLGRKTLGSR